MAQAATRVSTRPTARSASNGTNAAMERETRLVREAIAMVAAGASPRVVVAGIRYGEVILDSARRMALESGVRVNPIRRPDHNGADISVERILE